MKTSRSPKKFLTLILIFPFLVGNWSCAAKRNIEEKENGILNIKLDSILDYRVDGSTMIFVGGVDQDDVDYVENLSQSDFEILFIKQKIKALREE